MDFLLAGLVPDAGASGGGPSRLGAAGGIAAGRWLARAGPAAQHPCRPSCPHSPRAPPLAGPRQSS